MVFLCCFPQASSCRTSLPLSQIHFILSSSPRSKLCSLRSSVTADPIELQQLLLPGLFSLLQHNGYNFLLLKPNLARQQRRNYLQGALPVPPFDTSTHPAPQLDSLIFPLFLKQHLERSLQLHLASHNREYPHSVVFPSPPEPNTAPSITSTTMTPNSCTLCLPITDQIRGVPTPPVSLGPQTYSPPLSISNAPL